MGWQFRRIFSLGALRASMTKGGIGWSINLGICRVGVNPYGRKYVSMGIPGTGIYFMKYLDFRGTNKKTISSYPQENISSPPAELPNNPLSSNHKVLDRIKQLSKNKT